MTNVDHFSVVQELKSMLLYLPLDYRSKEPIHNHLVLIYCPFTHICIDLIVAKCVYEQSMFPRIEEMRGVDAFLCLPLLLLCVERARFWMSMTKKALKGLLHFSRCFLCTYLYSTPKKWVESRVKSARFDASVFFVLCSVPYAMLITIKRRLCYLDLHWNRHQQRF